MKNDCEATFVSDSVQDDTNEDDDNIDNIVKHKAGANPNILCKTQLLQMNRICNSAATAGVTQPSATIAIVLKTVYFVPVILARIGLYQIIHSMKDDITLKGLYNN